jgi:CHAT domain-containing protein
LSPEGHLVYACGIGGIFDLKQVATIAWLVASFSFAQDAQTPLAERLESAADDGARAAMLASEGPTLAPVQLLADLKSRGSKAFQVYDYNAARRSWQSALSVAEFLHKDAEIADCYEHIAHILYRQGRYHEAIQLDNQGLEAARKAGDREMEARLRRGVANAHFNMGEYRDAQASDEKVLKIYQDLDNQAQVAASFGSLGTDHREQGDTQVAIDYYRRALDLAKTLDLAETTNFALLGLVRVYSSQRDFNLALSYLGQVVPAKGTTLGDERWRSSVLAQYASIYNKLHRAEESLKAADEGFAITQHTHDDRLGAWFLEVRGEELEQLGRVRVAIDSYEKASEVFERIGAADQESAALVSIAERYFDLGEMEPALRDAEKAVALARKTTSLELISSALTPEGQVYRRLGRTQEAEAAFREAIELQESWRAKLAGGSTEGQRFYETRMGPYRELMQMRAESGDIPGAIATAERARARHLLDIVTQGRADITHAMSPEERDREAELGHIVSKRNATASASPQDQAAFEKAATDLETFRANLYMKHPDLKARRGESRPLSGEEIGALVPDRRTVLVEYVVGDSMDTYVFTIARGRSDALEFSTHKLPYRAPELTRRVEQFRSALGTRDLFYRQLAQSLYQDLLGPLENIIAGRAVIGILPDGPLWNLPFHALIGRDGKYLLEHAAIFYAPSLTSMREASARARPSKSQHTTLLAMAGGGLPFAEQEVRGLREIYGAASSSVYTGADATEARWKQDAPNYSILHLATHGILNPSNPLFSYLVLKGNNGQDGMLEAREILDLDMRAELAVLSACETARGEVLEGEGVFGLSWAMMMAGVRSVVVSQWKVDSASTTKFMLAFHRGLAKNLTSNAGLTGKAESLRQASLALLKTPEYQHPFYWAGFQMLGDGY